MSISLSLVRRNCRGRVYLLNAWRQEAFAMKNLFDAARVEEVKQRTARLRPDSERQWGKMNALQAVAHCSGGVELALGDMQAHGGATRFGDLPESLLQLCKF